LSKKFKNLGSFQTNFPAMCLCFQQDVCISKILMPTAHMLMIQLYNKYQVIPCSQNTACLVQY